MKYQKNKYIYILICFCLLTIATTMFMFSIKNYNRAAHKIIDFDNKNVESIYLRVSDVHELSEFFSEKDALHRMKEFCRILNREFVFLEFDTQSLMIKDTFNYKNNFREDYGTKYFGENDEYGIFCNLLR